MQQSKANTPPRRLAEDGDEHARSLPVLITGGAGFIGTNLARRFLSRKQPVLLYDNLSRSGAEQNLAWLRQKYGELAQFEVADVRDRTRLGAAVRRCSRVFHFAAQTAVTTSLINPTEDFEINAGGTLNLLEAIRGMDNPPPLIFASTSKVYGDMEDVKLQVRDGRYEPEDPMLRQYGFGEQRPLNFHTPHGCSKGAACQYVLDYARIFRIPAVAFRMGTVYGRHQLGSEGQGWIAHFLLTALENKPIKIFGNGRQVRDILFVDDLINALLQAMEKITALSGQVFNIGGGPANTVSLLELVDMISGLTGQKATVKFEDWRSVDQQYYVSDTRRFSAATGWKPLTTAAEGLRSVYDWLTESRNAEPGRILQVEPLLSRGTNHSLVGSCRKSSGEQQVSKTLSSTSGRKSKRAEAKLAKAV